MLLAQVSPLTFQRLPKHRFCLRVLSQGVINLAEGIFQMLGQDLKKFLDETSIVLPGLSIRSTLQRFELADFLFDQPREPVLGEINLGCAHTESARYLPRWFIEQDAQRI